MHIGELVSGTERLEYTHESIYRTEGNINYKKYFSLPKVSPEVLRLARTLANSLNNNKKNNTYYQKMEKTSDEIAISMINTRMQKDM
jgi:hypothetical protein